MNLSTLRHEPREPRDKVPVLYDILRAQYFLLLFAACGSFVCSVREFCLQRVGVLSVCSVLELCLQCAKVLFAACSSFVCSVQEFCLQRAGVLFAACSSFACSVHVFFLQFLFCLQCTDDFFDVLFMFAKNFFICSVFSLRKRCPLLSTLVKQLEDYLRTIRNPAHRISMTKLRLGVHSLRMQTGKYERGGARTS